MSLLAVYCKGVKVRYAYRLRPGRQAEAALGAEWDRCRWVWNQLVERKRNGEGWANSEWLTSARAEHDWLREGSQATQSAVLYSFPKVKGRNFKSKHRAPLSLDYTTRGFSIRNGRLRLAKCPPIPVVWHRDLPSPPTSARVYRDSTGHWWASFVVEVEDQPLPAVDRGIGVDWGVKAVATTTDPDYDLPHAEHGRRSAAELARSQRQMARRRRPRGRQASKGYQQARGRTAKLYAKVQRQRRHDARVWARRVVEDHDLIAVEDFHPKFLARSTMARKAADGAIGMTKRTLVECAQRAGREVVMVPPAYTTMTCANCAARAKQKLGLHERTFRCGACGYTADRDRNAARVVLATAEMNRALVEDVRHPDPPFRGEGCDPRAKSPRL